MRPLPPALAKTKGGNSMLCGICKTRELANKDLMIWHLVVDEGLSFSYAHNKWMQVVQWK